MINGDMSVNLARATMYCETLGSTYFFIAKLEVRNISGNLLAFDSSFGRLMYNLDSLCGSCA